MSDLYTDRRGQMHIPNESSKRIERRGVFGVFIVRDHLLLSWPSCAPDVPDLPGGGIEDGEDLLSALIREAQEEASVELILDSPMQTFVQQVKFYAEYDDAFWDYHQTFLQFPENDIEASFFDGERHPQDALKSQWIPLSDVSSLNMHAMHHIALKEFVL